ncbi:MAG: hypothetical protein ABIH55_04895 [Nanoarchaeota archaeon]|nr:hypothetical protein [Nanoarchaeota archaeon]
MLKGNEWKYLFRELIIKYGIDVYKQLKTNKTSLYNWLNGKSIPNSKIQTQIFTIFKESPKDLIKYSKLKEKTLETMTKINYTKNIINVAFLVKKDMMRRSKTSANSWYLEYIDNKIIRIRYFDSNKYWKTVILPTNIEWSENLAIILGFWLGDGVTKKPKNIPYRPYLTFVNRDITLLTKIKEFFVKTLMQNENVFDIEIIEGSLLNNKISKEYKKEIRILSNKIRWKVHGRWNSIGTCLHIRNTPLAFLFNYLLINIEDLLDKSSKNIKGAFLAGYFSAEGNVSTINKWFSFNETKKDRRNLIISMLKNIGFSAEDFGDRVNIAHRNNIREKDTKLFNKFIKNHLISYPKKKQTEMLIKGCFQRDIDLLYMYYLYLCKESNSNKLAKSFGKNKDHINKVFRGLENNKPKLVNRTRNGRNEFNVIKLTSYGKSIVEENKIQIINMLKEIKRLDKYKRHYKSSFILTNPKTQEKNNSIELMLKASGI